LAAARADTLLGRQYEEFLADGPRGVIAALGAGVLWLLTPLPLGSLRVVPRIIEVMGAIVPGLGFGASSQPIGWELACLALKWFDLLLRRGAAVEGLARARLPRSDLLTEFEVLALPALDFGVSRADLSAQVLDPSDQPRGGVARSHGTGALRKGRSRADGAE